MSNKEEQENFDYKCPLTHDYMLFPVKASDNHIYEKKSIMKWYLLNGTSPLTRERLSSSFILQKKLQIEIRNYLRKQQKYEIEKKMKFRCCKCQQIIFLESLSKYPLQKCQCGNIFTNIQPFTNNKTRAPRQEIPTPTCIIS